jgi:Uma2 family endonuclease
MMIREEYPYMDLAIDEKPYIEFLAGRAQPKVSPKRRHGIVQGRLFSIVRELAGDRGDVATEWRFWMSAPGNPRTSLVPDVAFVSHERLAALTPDAREEPPFAPDIAIEVRSPSDRIADVEWKMRAYLSVGSLLALDILPDEHALRAFTQNGLQIFRERQAFSSNAVPWLQFAVADVFADLRD